MKRIIAWLLFFVGVIALAVSTNPIYLIGHVATLMAALALSK